MNKEARVKILEARINKAEQTGNGSAGVVRKWKRQARRLKENVTH